MSERNVKLFYDEMCKNEKLQNEIKEVLGGANTESDKQALLNDIAKKYNFIFTSEEAKKFAENLSKNKLSLDDLSDVSGGIGRRTAILAFSALTALGSLGSAGAIVSHAAPPKNRQTQSSSTDKPKEENDKKGENDSKNYIVIDDSSDEIDTENYKKGENDSKNYIVIDDSSDEIDTENSNNPKKTTTPDVNGVEKEIIKQKNDKSQENMDNKEKNGAKGTIENQEHINKSKILKDKIKEVKQFCEKNNIYDGKIHEEIDNLLKSIESNLQIGKTYKSSENNLNKIIEYVNHKYYATRQEKEKKLNKLNSKIINEDNINIFEGLVCPTENLKPLYRMTNDGANREAIQNKLRDHSNIVVLVKTDENKIFGGYTSCTIDYNDEFKYDNKAFLFSIDLNKIFNVKENRYAIKDTNSRGGITFGNDDLELLGFFDSCYSHFGDDSNYENNGITRDEFFGGRTKEYSFGFIKHKYNEFKPIEIEIFEIESKDKEYSSKIIENDKDKETFENITTSTDNMKLAYRMSENKKINSTTIKNIKNLYNSIILIKTKEGNIFGGYITKEGVKDNNSFIFSIDKPDIFIYKKDSKDEIKLNINEIKLGKDLFIKLNANLNKENQSYLSIGNSYNNYEKTTKDIISGKEENNKIFFEIEEIEIFNTNEWKMNQILPYSSEIINADNKNIFEGLVSKTNKLQLLYRMTRDGAYKEAMQSKIEGHSNVVVLVKTDENKIFGGYTSFKIEYNHEAKHDNKAFLFSIDLNEKFNIKKNRYAKNLNEYSAGITFGKGYTGADLKLFDIIDNNKCYSSFGENFSDYKNNGITRNEFCGGEKISNFINEFKPIEIEVFEIKDEQNEQEDIKRGNEDNEANKKNKD